MTHQDLAVEDNWVSYSEMDTSKYTILLTSFGLLSSLITHPLSVIVTRKQSGALAGGENFQKLTVPRALIHISNRFGWKALFRGWAPVALMGIPSQVIYFTITESSREFLQLNIKRSFPNMSSSMVDGLQASVTSVLGNSISLLAYVPADVVSSRMIVQNDNFKNSIQMTKDIYKNVGIRGLYRGYTPSLIVGSIFSAQWWWTYSVTRRQLSRINNIKDNQLILDSVSGLLSGVIATITAHPFDTIKTRIMTGASIHSSMLKTIKYVYKNEGTKAFMRGIIPSIYLSCISSTGFAITYELIKRQSSLD